MIKSYLHIALRHLIKYKSYTAIRLLGLSVGMGFFLLIMLFVQHEYRVKRQFAGADQIYRVNSINSLENSWKNKPSKNIQGLIGQAIVISTGKNDD